MQDEDQHTIYCSQCQRQVALKQCSELLQHKLDENDVNTTVRLLRESQHSADDGNAPMSSPVHSPHSRKRDRESSEADQDAEQGPSKRARTEHESNTNESNVGTTAPETNTAHGNTTHDSTSTQHTASPYQSPTATMVRDKPFDPANEHRYFCPWINCYDEGAQTSLVAWQKGLIALFSLPASATDQAIAAPMSFSDFQAILNRVRAVVQTPNKKCK